MENFIGEMGMAIAEFGPKLIAATVALVVGWLIARLAAMAITRGVDSLDVVKRVTHPSEGKGVTLGAGLGKAAFWVILLFALTIALNLLGLTSVVAPLTSLIETIMAFLPNLAGAVMIFGVGYLFASVARRAIISVLQAARLGSLLEKASLSEAVNVKSLPNVCGLVVFVLIMLPVAVASLDALHIEAVSQPLTTMLLGIMSAIPNFVMACVVLVATFAIARLVGRVLMNVLPQIGLDRALEAMSIFPSQPSANLKPSMVIARVVSILIGLFGAIEAANLLKFEMLSAALSQVLTIGGSVIFGAVIIGFGVWMAQIVARTMSSSADGAMDLVARIVKWLIIFLASSIGLKEMGLADELIVSGFSFAIGGVAVAAAIAFGLGGREWAGKMLDRWTKSEDQ